MSARASFEGPDAGTLRFTGSLSLACLGDLPDRLSAVTTPVERLDLSGIEGFDTVGAWVVHRFSLERDARIEGLTEDRAHLLSQVSGAAQPVKMREQPVTPFVRVVAEIGTATALAGRTLLGLLGFLGATALAFLHLLRHPRRFRVNAVVQRFEVVGVTALGIIGLMSFLIGLVIAQQGAVQLSQFGAEARLRRCSARPSRPPAAGRPAHWPL